jgi:hypothetical protein
MLSELAAKKLYKQPDPEFAATLTATLAAQSVKRPPKYTF